MSSYAARQRDKWLRVAQTWYTSKPPAIPSPGDLEIFADALASLKNEAHVAVLGSTPSLRAIAQRSPRKPRFPVLVVDFLQEMYTNSAAFCDHDISRERFVCADWCSTGLSDESVDAIVGDKVIDNVHPSKWHEFFSELFRILTPAGLLAIHLGLTDESSAINSVAAALTMWADKYSKGQCDLDEASAGLWDDLLSASAELRGDGTLSLSYWNPELETLIESAHAVTLINGVIGLEQAKIQILTALKKTFGDTFEDVWADCRMLPVLEVATQYFDLTKVRTASDYMKASSQPILILRRKQELHD